MGSPGWLDVVYSHGTCIFDVVHAVVSSKCPDIDLDAAPDIISPIAYQMDMKKLHMQCPQCM